MARAGEGRRRAEAQTPVPTRPTVPARPRSADGVRARPRTAELLDSRGTAGRRAAASRPASALRRGLLLFACLSQGFAPGLRYGSGLTRPPAALPSLPL